MFRSMGVLSSKIYCNQIFHVLVGKYKSSNMVLFVAWFCVNQVGVTVPWWFCWLRISTKRIYMEENRGLDFWSGETNNGSE